MGQLPFSALQIIVAAVGAAVVIAATLATVWYVRDLRKSRELFCWLHWGMNATHGWRWVKDRSLGKAWDECPNPAWLLNWAAWVGVEDCLIREAAVAACCLAEQHTTEDSLWAVAVADQPWLISCRDYTLREVRLAKARAMEMRHGPGAAWAHVATATTAVVGSRSTIEIFPLRQDQLDRVRSFITADVFAKALRRWEEAG